MNRVGVNPKGRKVSKFEKVKGNFVFTPDLLKTVNVYGETKKITLLSIRCMQDKAEGIPDKKQVKENKIYKI